MDIDIRNSILNNFKNTDSEEIKKSIEESINDNEEITLPGLGVFFEVVWKNANDELKDSIIKIIENKIKSESNN